MNLKQNVQQALTPKSDQHLVRIILGGLAVAGAVFKYVTHQGVWSRDDLIALALMLLTGMGVVFTGSIVSLLKAVPVPWRKPNGNGGG